MKNVCFVNGSLRGKQSASLEFLNDISLVLPDEQYSKKTITVRPRIKGSYPVDTLKKMADADAIIFVFPLHNYCLPGALMRLLEDYYQYVIAGNGHHKDALVYMVVNCAFPRPGDTTGEAIRVMKNFCRRLSLNYRFAVCIGTGPVVVMTKKFSFLYPKLGRAYRTIASDLRGGNNGHIKDFLIKPVIPEAVIALIKKYYEKKGRMMEGQTG